ncbi:MAG TPA: thiamine phosphate synthase [Fluviicola sp.]|nr:thiamine phosphate synthase [Fluviicola sp.]
MIILFTTPDFHSNESLLLNRMLEESTLRVHLRKPGSSVNAFEQLLARIDPGYHSRVVIHQHHSLAEKYDLGGIHFTEADRQQNLMQKAVSTSFHDLQTAINEQNDYRYFFCSPVFPSISKTGYSTDENWNISQEPDSFRQKAVALGGIDVSRLNKVRERGFQHIALLGAVWQVADPVKELQEVFRRF